MEDRLLTIAKRFWPELETMSGLDRAVGVVDVIGFLYGAPLALAGLGWLISATDLQLIQQEWLTLLLLFGLLFLFSQLGFFYFFEAQPGTFARLGGSLQIIVTWSAALIFGPTALWLPVLLQLIESAYAWKGAASIGGRWGLARQLALDNLTVSTLVNLIALTFYQRWGGVFPLPGLWLEAVLPALFATLLRLLLSRLVFVPFLVGLSTLARSAPAAEHAPSPGMPLGTVIGLMFVAGVADPFAILAAGLYTQNGLATYLFFVAAMLLASLLARQLGQAVVRSQHRTRELERLEELGRAILDAPPDASMLPDLLNEHVPSMFANSQIQIRLFPDETLLHHPADQPAVARAGWDWLRTTPEAHHVLPRQAPPWLEHPTGEGIIVAPILNVGSSEPIGGIYVSRDQELGSVAALLPAVQSLAAQIASALNGAKVYAQTVAHHKVEQELALAGRIQANFLPEDPLDIPGWQVGVTLKPARETSGDFYDLIPLPNGQIGIVMADVTDKGMGAALFMALSRTLIRTYVVDDYAEPGRALRAANRRILADTRTGLFVTVFCGVLEPETGVLTYCNAGHDPPFLLDAQDGDAVQALRRTGLPLGIFKDEAWEQRTVQLAPGSVLVLYTDGITEARNQQEVLFGAERLLEVVVAHRGSSARQIQEAVVAALHGFVADAPYAQDDDITLMVLVRRSEKQQADI